MIFDKLLGFITVQRKIEEKMIQLAFIPSKYLEALYVECGTKIPLHTLDICEVEEKQIRGELLKYMKKGQVDTKIEVEKFQLFERINSVSIKAKEVRNLLGEKCDDLDEEDYKRLTDILKDASDAGKLMHKTIKYLYEHYTQALISVTHLKRSCSAIIDNLFSFKYCEGEDCEYDLEKAEMLIGNAIRAVLQDMIIVGEKVEYIVRLFSYQHDLPKEETEEEKKLNLRERIQLRFDNRKAKRELKKSNRKFAKDHKKKEKA